MGKERADAECDPVRKAVLHAEALRLEESANSMVVVLSAGDDTATIEITLLFERVGAMLTPHT